MKKHFHLIRYIAKTGYKFLESSGGFIFVFCLYLLFCLLEFLDYNKPISEISFTNTKDFLRATRGKWFYIFI